MLGCASGHPIRFFVMPRLSPDWVVRSILNPFLGLPCWSALYRICLDFENRSLLDLTRSEHSLIFLSHQAAQPASALAAIPVFRTFLPGRTSSHQHRWSASSELHRPHTADAAARKRASWTGAPSNANESGRSAQFRRTSEREAVAR